MSETTYPEADAGYAQQLLDETERKDLLRFVTCGSVDDGKSTLIGRLLYESKGIYEDQLAAVEKASKTVGTTGGDIDLALVTDGLKAEREQGITIDVAYRYFSTPRRKFIIADCPGHEQYTRNMATGASTANLAILLVDATKGVIVQTRRHAFIASLLGIKHIVVAVNKMDLAGWDEAAFRSVRRDFTDFSARLGFSDVAFIPMSALAGDNVVEPSKHMPWYGGLPLLSHLENVHVAGDRNLVDMRLPVQYVSRPDRTFRGYMGTVAGGVIRPGEEIVVLPAGTRTTVKTVLGPGAEEVAEASAGQAVCITTTQEVDASRGDVIAPVNNVPRVGNRFDAMLVWMDAKPMQPGGQYIIKHTARDVPARFKTLRYRTDVNTLRQHPADKLELNEVGRVEVELARPVAYDAYAKNRSTGGFVVIDRQTHGTVAAGMILDRETIESQGGRPSDKAATPQATTHRHRSLITAQERATRLQHKPFCVWLTGLKGSGKTTVAYQLERELFDLGLFGTVLDGGNLRGTLGSDLGYAGRDRREHSRRAAATAVMLADAGLFSVVSLIAPFADDRKNARRQLADAVGDDGVIEVFLDAPIEVCRRRAGGTYEQADGGEFESFTGVDAPYERPESPDVHLRTDEVAAEACVRQIIELLRERGLVSGGA